MYVLTLWHINNADCNAGNKVVKYMPLVVILLDSVEKRKSLEQLVGEAGPTRFVVLVNVVARAGRMFCDFMSSNVVSSMSFWLKIDRGRAELIVWMQIVMMSGVLSCIWLLFLVSSGFEFNKFLHWFGNGAYLWPMTFLLFDQLETSRVHCGRCWHVCRIVI